MKQPNPVSIAIVEEDGKSIIVRRFAGGKETREPVVPRKKMRRPKRPPLRVGRNEKT